MVMPETQHHPAASHAFGRAVRELRREARLTETQLARRVGVGLSEISAVEHGRGVLPLAAIWSYAEALHVEPRILLAAIRRCAG
jgi:transcriptional regulator with XRE-family HTH domain